MINLKDWVDSVWRNDADLQTEFLKVLVSDIRHVSDESIQEQDIAYLRSLGAFYIPDDIYLKMVVGDEVTQYKYGVYRYGYCTLSERLAIPMWTPNGRVIGFIGYSNSGVDETVSVEDIDNFEATNMFSELDSSDIDSESDDIHEAVSSSKGKLGIVIKYLYPPSYVMTKGKYIFCHPSWFKKALADGYVCITDGIFDAIRLNQNGINAFSLCGSKLTDWHKLYLSLFDKIIVIHDNDSAGVALANKCCKELNNCSKLSFVGTKDIDDFLKSADNIKLFKSKLNTILSGMLDTKILKSSEFRDKYGNLKDSTDTDIPNKDSRKSNEIFESDWEKQQHWSNSAQSKGRDILDTMSRRNRLHFIEPEISTTENGVDKINNMKNHKNSFLKFKLKEENHE